MSGLGGGGDAWSKDHDKILKHARDLGYDKTGVSLPSADAPKGTWIPAMDAFNAWKDSERAKPESQRWWVTRPWTADEGTSHHGESSGHSGGLLSPPPASINRGPYPLPNEYFPLLTTDYVRPQAIPGDAYMNQYFNQGAYQVPNAFSALSYQPGTEQYHEAFPLHESILEYQPNIFGVGPIQYYAPTSPLEVAHHEESSSDDDDDKYDWATDPEGKKGGKGLGDVGYDPANDSDVSLADAVAGIFGLTDFNDWGDVQGDDSVGGFPGTGAFGSTSPTE